jgi:dephospho-CoA kinase
MFVVALTGGIGSGKSTAAAIFAELGVPITDLDVISHALTAANQPLLQDIKANFGSQFINANGALDRSAMRELVFNNVHAREKLNAILHPAIYKQAIQQLAKQAEAPYQILAIPLLFESPRYMPHIDRILVIDCDEQMQIARVKSRSNLPEADIIKIIHAQTGRKKQLSLANDVVMNDGDVEKLRDQIVNIHEKYINTCILSKTT